MLISAASTSQHITGFEWESDRRLIPVIVLKEGVFHVSDIFCDNSFGQTGWKITFLRLAAALAFIAR